MKIWVDADACPKGIRDIIIRAAERLKIKTVFVANSFMRMPPSEYISAVQVQMGADVADGYIVSNAAENDIVVTQDIPLAAILVKNNVQALDPRGELYTEQNIGQRLSMRNFMDFMRGSGEITGGPRSFGDREKQKFAANFDKIVTKTLKAQSTPSA